MNPTKSDLKTLFPKSDFLSMSAEGFDVYKKIVRDAWSNDMIVPCYSIGSTRARFSQVGTLKHETMGEVELYRAGDLVVVLTGLYQGKLNGYIVVDPRILGDGWKFIKA